MKISNQGNKYRCKWFEMHSSFVVHKKYINILHCILVFLCLSSCTVMASSCVWPFQNHKSLGKYPHRHFQTNVMLVAV